MVNSDRRLAMTIRYKDLVRFRDYVAKTGGAASVDRLRVTDQELRAMEKEFQREFSCSIQSSAYGGGASASGENQSTAGNTTLPVTNTAKASHSTTSNDDDGHSTTTVEDSDDERINSAMKRLKDAAGTPRPVAAAPRPSIASSSAAMTNATSSQDDATLEIYVVDRLEGNRGSHPLRYLYKANRPLARLFIHCRQHLMSSKKVGPLDATNHRFVYRKKALSDEQTPAQLGMAAGVQNFIDFEYRASGFPSHSTGTPSSSKSSSLPLPPPLDSKTIATPSSTTGTGGSSSQPPPDKLRINVRRPFGSVPVATFRISAHQALQSLFRHYGKLHNLDYKRVIFHYKGDYLSDLKSPKMLGMNDNDFVDAYTPTEFQSTTEYQMQQAQEAASGASGVNDAAGGQMINASLATTMGLDQGGLNPMWNSSVAGVSEEELNKRLESLLDCFSVDIPRNERMDAPAAMTVQLKEYQRIGVAWMTKMETGNVHGGILSDEMGLGKTIQTIAAVLANPRPLAIEAQRPGNRRRYATLVVMPLSLLIQWQNELESMVEPAHKLKILPYHSDFMTAAQKRVFVDKPESFGRYDCSIVVILTTYATVANQFPYDKAHRRAYTQGSYDLDRDDPDVGPIFRFKWFRIVLDEAHTIKNRQSQTSVACSFLEAERRWCLTGTPIQNSSDDLYSLFRFLKLQPYCWWNKFNNDLSVQPKKNKTGPYRSLDDRMQKLQAILQCCLLRRTKSTRIDGSSEPLIKLPEREISQDQPDFTEIERELYTGLEQRNLRRFEKMVGAGSLERHYRSILVMIMRMRQLCLHPKLVSNNFTLKTDITDVNKLDDLLAEMTQACVQRLRTLITEDEANECAICLDAAVNPATTLCAHVFCEECITNYIKTVERNNTDCVCPHCRAEIRQEELIPISVLETKFREEADKEDEEAGADGVAEGKGKEAAIANGEDGNKDASEDDEWEPSTKITRLMELLEETQRTAPQEKTIVFCSFTRMLDMVEPALKKAGIYFKRLDGTMNIKDRNAAVQSLSDPKSLVTVMLISLRCGSVGLNLTAANRVILLDVWWNPALESQAIDRVHRIGQTAERVIVTKITIPNTIEDRIMELQKLKQELTDKALNEGSASGNGAVSRLSRNDLLYLFRGGRPPGGLQQAAIQQ